MVTNSRENISPPETPDIKEDLTESGSGTGVHRYRVGAGRGLSGIDRVDALSNWRGFRAIVVDSLGRKVGAGWESGQETDQQKGKPPNHTTSSVAPWGIISTLNECIPFYP